MKMLAVLLGFVGALAVALAIYVRVGGDRMETAWSANPPGGPSWHAVGYGWSWKPLGFQCTYDDGRRRSSLWF